MLACFAANPDVGSASKPYAVSILHGGKLHFQQLPSGKMAVLLLRVGLHKLGLASHLHQIRIDKQLKRKLAKSERDLLKGLEELDAEQKGKP